MEGGFPSSLLSLLDMDMAGDEMPEEILVEFWIDTESAYLRKLAVSMEGDANDIDLSESFGFPIESETVAITMELQFTNFNEEIEPIVVRLLSVTKSDSGVTTALGIDKTKELIQITDVSGAVETFGSNSILECMPSKIFGNIIKIDQDSFVRKIEDDSLPNISELRTKISEIKEENGLCIEAIILKTPERREIQTKNGETIALSEMFVEDDTAQIWVKAWRKQADLLNDFTSGDVITVLGVNAKPGLEGKIELVLTSYSKIMKKN